MMDDAAVKEDLEDILAMVDIMEMDGMIGCAKIQKSTKPRVFFWERRVVSLFEEKSFNFQIKIKSNISKRQCESH